ncbi:MAG TPA: class I SAM-dependent methyltransferase [Leptospiraceae bacterium]|nr:class I SAM-dependent methyltransferase [Leptospiraceae bacterium]HNI28593.1 class I SAM-dependent methyltransferase [Leptospiraceae bacterium]HNM05961.1 class I SAM-dependent methyltransferase [Leptospiraceae bacterium]HNN05351.1 class I SAM-dependent methyltransferase [Leptospiraceae bacterium]
MNPYPFTERPASDFPQKPPFYFSNFGLWEKEEWNYADAAFRMAEACGEHLNIMKSSWILDIGSGLGGSLFVWKKRFGAEKVTGINLPGAQTEFALSVLKKEKLSGMEIISGSWEKIQEIPSETFSQSVVLDCIYHFQNQKLFAEELYRVLRTGGSAAVTNIIYPSEKCQQGMYGKLLSLSSGLSGIPKENRMDADAFQKKFTDSGFRLIRNEKWGGKVFTGFRRFTSDRNIFLKFFGAVLESFYRKGLLEYEFFLFEKI